LYRIYNKKYVYNKLSKYDKNDFLKYLDLYAGPEYSFDSKLANTNMLIFLTIIFGPMIPLLFPIAFFAVLVQYLSEKVLLSYFYRLPPKYSEKLVL
jgi:hypothetical protein